MTKEEIFVDQALSGVVVVVWALAVVLWLVQIIQSHRTKRRGDDKPVRAVATELVRHLRSSPERIELHAAIWEIATAFPAYAPEFYAASLDCLEQLPQSIPVRKLTLNLGRIRYSPDGSGDMVPFAESAIQNDMMARSGK